MANEPRMQVSCGHCGRVLDYAGDRPSFCAYCGRLLGGGRPLRERLDPRLVATQAHPRKRDVLPAAPGEGAKLEPEPDPERIANYRLLRPLGRGGMGVVYEAEDVELGRRVALKLINAANVASPEAVERFRQEGRLASTIAHPRCVFVLAADEDNGRPYIVMELMPGETLQTLVESRGPLPVEEAITKILDVIEGLQEAHHQGVIHRDVKPSNCFLEAGGRVKVGDFGLSKSLEGGAELTHTGTFLGTPLYASPEQIKRGPVDERADVYSVAATLYYLLTGQPPFDAGDAAATLARIVSEDPSPMRRVRPGLPAALDAVVLRGLERDRDRRWQDLARFRLALLPFVSRPLRLTDMPLRVSAYLADVLLLLAVDWVVLTFVLVLSPFSTRLTFSLLGRYAPWFIPVRRAIFLGYFGICEGAFGMTLGKRLTGLRVSRAAVAAPPGAVRAAGRVVAFYVLTGLPGDGMSALLLTTLPPREALVHDWMSFAFTGLGFLAMTASMRRGEGFRGVHEWLSGTQVVRLSGPVRRRAPVGKARPQAGTREPVRACDRVATERPVSVLREVGPFRVHGALRWDGHRRVLLGEDPTLGRPVWIAFRPKGAAPPPPARRDLGRPSRPRWLSGGELAEGRWDAYVAPGGCPLTDLAGPDGLTWADVRPILHDLADELACADEDGTLPESLDVDQVWIQPDGSVQLADPLAAPGQEDALTARRQDRSADQERALALLRRTAALALEGGRRPGGATTPSAIHAAVPEHAARMLDRLIGRPRRGDRAYTDLKTLVADLEADRELPTAVDAARRAGQLAATGLLMAPLLALMFLVSYPTGPVWPATLNDMLSNMDLPLHSPPRAPLAWVLAVPAAWVAWATLTRGGLLKRLAGLALVRSDSRPASRLRCGWRATVAWGPVAVLLAGACLARARGTAPASWVFWCLAVAIVLVYPVLALLMPSRSLHDRLAGTALVPK